MEEQIESIATPKPQLRKVILIAALLVVLISGALTFGGYYYVTGEVLFGLDGLFASEPEEITFEMDSFLVNLRGSRSHYLKATIALSFMDPEAKDQVQAYRSQIRDTVIQYLRSKSQEDFVQSDNLEPFKAELKAQIDLLFNEEILYNIYFTEFLIQ